MISRRCLLLALGGLFTLVLIVNIHFIRMIVESSSQPFENNLPVTRSKTKNSTVHKNDEIQSTKMKQMEENIRNKLQALPSKYSRINASYILILDQLFSELKTNNFVQNDIWNVSNNWPTAEYLIPSSAPRLGAILNAMRKSKIIKADNSGLGTQLKLLLNLQNGMKVLFKPQWYTRETIIRGPVYRGKDRHNAEIVAFHLSSLLGLRRVPLAAIRTINLKDEIQPNATPQLLKTMYQDNNNTCVYGVCHYCSITDPVCSTGNLLEGALILWLPSNLKLTKYRHPWQRMYTKNKFALWETDSGYCEKVKNTKLYLPESSRRLLDLINAAIFDFLLGNGDRHHYELFEKSFKNPAILLLDNGKSLGNPNVDHYDILAPLYQCCMIHKSTWDRLTLLSGGALSRSLNKLLSYEAEVAKVLPLLTIDHLNAMDRRLLVIYAVVELCIQEKKLTLRVIKDH